MDLNDREWGLFWLGFWISVIVAGFWVLKILVRYF
jgi:hypothetical protein